MFSKFRIDDNEDFWICVDEGNVFVRLPKFSKVNYNVNFLGVRPKSETYKFTKLSGPIREREFSEDLNVVFFWKNSVIEQGILVNILMSDKMGLSHEIFFYKCQKNQDVLLTDFVENNYLKYLDFKGGNLPNNFLCDRLDNEVSCFRVSSEDNSLSYLDVKVLPNIDKLNGKIKGLRKLHGYTEDWSISWSVFRADSQYVQAKLCIALPSKTLTVNTTRSQGFFHIMDFQIDNCSSSPLNQIIDQKEEASSPSKETKEEETDDQSGKKSEVLDQVDTILIDEFKKTLSQPTIDEYRLGVLIRALKKQKINEIK